MWDHVGIGKGKEEYLYSAIST